MSIRGRAAIVGIGQTEFSRDSGRSEWQLAMEAILAALADAGIEARDVDGLVRYSYDNVTPAMVVRGLGMRDVRWFSDIPFGGTAQCGVIAQAAAAIHAGIARTVVVWRALNERSGVRYGRAERHIAADGEFVRAAGDRTPSGQFAGPYGLHVPGQSMALWAQRYAHEAGLDAERFAEVLGRIAVQQRWYANRNPRAMMHDRPLDMPTYLAGRMIAAPLRLYDYCLESDGAAALVLTGADTARALRDDPVQVLAAQQSLFPHSEPITVYAHDLMVHTGPGNTEKLFADAGVAVRDLSLAQFYDATSFMVLSDLETYGIAPPGQGWRHVLEQGTGLDARLPINTHGGHLSEGYIHGLNHITEAVRQLRGTASNQVRDAETVLLGCNGASGAILARA
ncbi:thiolase C-terminal domain-containing protein [Pseudorhodoferax sp.]|uniref:thiolase C-terminal domain-containing protein n=1 Tax=Pseudorhodoferax sp. TaxID=1993553 RepID=UPI002DD64C00|nr:lipid-transfer protein [Pseudorhodoferax sp.]